MLLYRHGVLGRRDPRSLFQNANPLLHPPDLQLCAVLPAAIPPRSLSSSPTSSVSVIREGAYSSYDEKTDLLYPSKAVFENPPPLQTHIVLEIMSLLGLVRLERAVLSAKEADPAKTGGTRIVSTTNLTILNFLLVRLGPMREPTLCIVVGAIQVACSALAFAIRYGVGSWVYGGDRR